MVDKELEDIMAKLFLLGDESIPLYFFEGLGPNHELVPYLDKTNKVYNLEEIQKKLSDVVPKVQVLRPIVEQINNTYKRLLM